MVRRSSSRRKDDGAGDIVINEFVDDDIALRLRKRVR